MNSLVMAEVVSALAALVIYAGMFVRRDSSESSRRLRYVIVFCIFWALIDAGRYMFNGPAFPFAFLFVINLLAYTMGSATLVGFLYYCKALLSEKIKINPWVFHVPAIFATATIGHIFMVFVMGIMYTYKDGYITMLYGVPFVSIVVYMAILIYIPIIVFINHKVLSSKTLVIFALYGLLPFIGMVIYVVFDLDNYIVISALFALIIVAELLQGDQVILESREHIKEISTLDETLQNSNDVFANAGFGIWQIGTNADGKRYMEANSKLREILGIEDMEMTSEELYDFYHVRLHVNSDEIEEDDYEDMMSGNIRSRVLAWEHPSKGTIYIRAGGRSFVHKDGSTTISGYCGDITEQKTIEDTMNASLEEARRQAEEASKAKTAFLFSMSHDIRTPMNAIIGFTDLLEKNIDNHDKVIDYLAKIRKSNTFLLALINDVLEVARIENGSISLDEKVCNFEDFASEIRAVFMEQMTNKGINFIPDYDIEHQYFYADIVKLKEIMLNIISNAYKYTPKGGSITLSIREYAAERNGYMRIETIVTDTGVGMSEEFLPRIYDVFTRAKTATENGVEGTGLGMPIVKKLIDLMGGRIEIKSEVGKGTSVRVSIEHRIASERTVKRIQEDGSGMSFKGKRILLAEDNDFNAEIAIEILSEIGFEVERAEDGAIAVSMMKDHFEDYYDVILMDVQMPNMNGYEATAAIRQLVNIKKSSIPILAMTANAFEQDKEDAINAGMNGHLAKPVDIAKMMKELSRVLM